MFHNVFQNTQRVIARSACIRDIPSCLSRCRQAFSWFAGDSCDEYVDFCVPDLCLSATSVCHSEPLVGAHCAARCTSHVCYNGGVCVENSESAAAHENNTDDVTARQQQQAQLSCTCQQHFTGQFCETNLLDFPCYLARCSSHSTCVPEVAVSYMNRQNRTRDVTRYSCACHDGYAGTYCEYKYAEYYLRPYQPGWLDANQKP